MRHRSVSILLLAALLALAPVAARADWRPNGSVLAARSGAVITSDGRGGLFAGTGYPEHFAQAYEISASGDSVPGWPVAGRTLTPSNSILEHNSITPVVMLPDGTGGMFLLTAEQIGYTGSGGFLFPVQFFVHRRTSTGNPAPGWTEQGVLLSAPVIDHTFEVRHLPIMVADEQGGVLAAWLYDLTTEFPDPPLHAQRVTGAGVRVWGDDGIVVHAGPGASTLPTLVADGSGGALVFWGQWDAPRTSLRVFGQHIAAGGRALWTTDGQAVSTGTFDRMDQAAPPDGGWIRQFYAPAIAACSDGEHGAILGWAAASGADLNVYAARVMGDGSGPWRADRVLCAAAGEQASVVGVGAPTAGAVFAWRDGRVGDDVSLRAQLITRNGLTRWARGGAIISEGSGNRGPLVFVNDGRDGYMFAWAEPHFAGQVFAQRVLGNGRRDPGWARNGALVSTRVAPDPDQGTFGLGIERSTRGSAIVTWSDLAVGSLAMRLTRRGPAAAPAPPVAAPAPPAASIMDPPVSFALLRVTPQPVVGAATLRFALPSAASASLALFDIAGRPVWSRDVGALGAGEHVVPLADGRHLPAGIYFARLTQGVRAATRRVVMLR